VRRQLRRLAGVLLGVDGILLFVAIPVIGLMLLGSLWEGGDEALKHRLLAWGLVSVAGNVAAGVLLICASSAVLRDSPGARSLVATCAVVLVVLGAGWAWVFQGVLVSDSSQLGLWALLTLPGLVAGALVVAADGRHSASP
jgi:hypothetical protein